MHLQLFKCFYGVKFLQYVKSNICADLFTASKMGGRFTALGLVFFGKDKESGKVPVGKNLGSERCGEDKQLR